MQKVLMSSQKAWLSMVKRSLTKKHPELTWDALARLVDVDPQVFNSYRMRENSNSYRSMPNQVKLALETLLIDNENYLEENYQEDTCQAISNKLLIPALAAMVIRQAHLSLIENRMITGISRTSISPIGLTDEDRRAMGALSRACLERHLPDIASEIHDLLYLCTFPLGEWLKIPEVLNMGFAETILIHSDEGVPTVDAEELASNFTGMTAGIEEQLFAKFVEIIGRFHGETANEYYTRIREFVVRHPTCTADEIKSFCNDLPSILWLVIQQEFYEQIPMSWASNGKVARCNHCGNCMKLGKAGVICRTRACVAGNPISSYTLVPSNDLQRVSRGIRQYWVEPGIDELRLYDALIVKGLDAKLYPFRDRVDIAVGRIGLDLKTYASPESLGTHLKKGIGGLNYYESKWVVIPDWQINSVPSFIDRLKHAIDRPDLECLTLTEALNRLVQTGGNYA